MPAMAAGAPRALQTCQQSMLALPHSAAVECSRPTDPGCGFEPSMTSYVALTRMPFYDSTIPRPLWIGAVADVADADRSKLSRVPTGAPGGPQTGDRPKG